MWLERLCASHLSKVRFLACQLLLVESDHAAAAYNFFENYLLMYSETGVGNSVMCVTLTIVVYTSSLNIECTTVPDVQIYQLYSCPLTSELRRLSKIYYKHFNTVGVISSI